jgi:peptide-methionine (S)-S-oxide reductase
MEVAKTIKTEKPEGLPTLTVGGGCFWCLESEFRRLEGVVFTRSGYAGGHIDHPDYRAVTTGTTGHAEAVEITYDPALISAPKLLDYFLRQGHDPTTLNAQGVDEGPQYRSVIFYTTDAEKKQAEDAIAAAQSGWKSPIITTVEKLDNFWEAEDYHQQYYEKYEAENGQKHIRVLIKEKKKQAAGLLK